MTASPTATTATSPSAPPLPVHRADVDLMRLAACVTVMLGHAGGTLIRRTRESETDSAATVVGHIAEGVNPWAVPMFFAIAGWAVLFGAPPRQEQTMLKRIIRHAAPLFVWTALYLLIYNAIDTDAVDLRRQAVQSLFGSGRPSYHLWYLYAYIPLITAFGALMLFWRGQRPWILVAFGLLFATGGVISEHSQAALDLDLGWWSWGFGTYSAAFFIFGGFLVHQARTFTVPRWLIVIVFLLAATGVYFWETEVHYPIQNANPLTFILAACVVLMCGTISLSDRSARLLKKLASASFGAFLIHIFFVDLMFWHLFPLDLPWPATAGLFIICWVAVAAVSFALSLTWGALKLRRVLG